MKKKERARAIWHIYIYICQIYIYTGKSPRDLAYKYIYIYIRPSRLSSDADTVPRVTNSQVNMLVFGAKSSTLERKKSCAHPLGEPG